VTNTLYDCTAVLGGYQTHVGLPSSRFWYGEFARVVDLLAPLVRHATQSDYFYNALSTLPTGRKLHPRKWVERPSFPPCHETSHKRMARFGFRVPCDHKDRSGCDEWLEIYREYDLFPDRAVYSVGMSNGVHRIACNHCFARARAGSVLGVQVPALHPAIELFMRLKVRDCAEGGHPRLTMTRLLPMLTKHLRETTFLHCGRRLPETDECKEVARSKGACCHPFTYDELSRQESGYFAGANAMPQPVQRIEVKRNGQGAATSILRSFTPDIPVTIHHMTSRRGACPSGRAIYETRLKEKIADKLLDLNSTFMRQEDAPLVDSLRPADSTMPAIHSLFEKGNLFRAWSRYVSDIDTKKACNFDIYQWRLIGILYRKKSQEEMRRGKQSNVCRGDDGAMPPLSVRDFEPPPSLQSTRRNEREYEMVLVMGSVASLFTGLMAWACRKVTHGVVLGMDHMYNMLKGVANVSLPPCSTHTRPYPTKTPSHMPHPYRHHTMFRVFLCAVLSVYRRCDVRERHPPPHRRSLAGRSWFDTQRSRRVGVAACGRMATTQRLGCRSVHAAGRGAPQYTAGARFARSVLCRCGGRNGGAS